MWKAVLEFIQGVIRWVVMLLPDSPFRLIDSAPVAQYLPYINWFVPVSQIVVILEIWLSAIIVYYSYQAILRWTKAIGS